VKAPDEAAGKTGKCRCGEPLRIPVPSPPPAPKVTKQQPKTSTSLHVPTPVQSVSTLRVAPRGELIWCYACQKQIADTAPTCPKCGALQSPEGRQKGRNSKNVAEFIGGIFAFIVVVPIFFVCLGGMSSGNRSGHHNERPPLKWDMEQLRQDANEVARDPSKTILVPYDGSQPRLVPNPDWP
jgi:hypothetical protein